jgi:hypothetical protein
MRMPPVHRDRGSVAGTTQTEAFSVARMCVVVALGAIFLVAGILRFPSAWTTMSAERGLSGTWPPLVASTTPPDAYTWLQPQLTRGDHYALVFSPAEPPAEVPVVEEMAAIALLPATGVTDVRKADVLIGVGVEPTAPEGRAVASARRQPGRSIWITRLA